jgi:hypothetical protein
MVWSPTLALRSLDEAVAVVGLAGLEPGLHGSEGLVTPFGEPSGRDAKLAVVRCTIS